MTEQALRTHWRGIEVEIRFDPLKFGCIAFLSVESVDPPRAPLPVSSTGYMSRFFPPEETPSDIQAAVIDWFNEAAESREWKKHEQDEMQPELF